MPFEKDDVRINRTGRPMGSQNKVPDRQKAVELLNKVIEDLSSQFEFLTTEEKIKLLQVFKGLFDTNITVTENQLPTEIKINIIPPTNYE
jgi:hypothetical protein